MLFPRSCVADDASLEEYVAGAVGVAGDEIRGAGGEQHLLPVRSNGGRSTPAVALPPVAVNGHAGRDTSSGVVPEDVSGLVRVADDEVGGIGLEGDEAAVVTDGGRVAAPVASDAAGRRRDESGLAGLAVVDEEVHPLVGVGDPVEIRRRR